MARRSQRIKLGDRNRDARVVRDGFGNEAGSVDGDVGYEFISRVVTLVKRQLEVEVEADARARGADASEAERDTTSGLTSQPSKRARIEHDSNDGDDGRFGIPGIGLHEEPKTDVEVEVCYVLLTTGGFTWPSRRPLGPHANMEQHDDDDDEEAEAEVEGDEIEKNEDDNGDDDQDEVEEDEAENEEEEDDDLIAPCSRTTMWS